VPRPFTEFTLSEAEGFRATASSRLGSGPFAPLQGQAPPRARLTTTRAYINETDPLPKYLKNFYHAVAIPLCVNIFPACRAMSNS
jgi:hypothetical protein